MNLEDFLYLPEFETLGDAQNARPYEIAEIGLSTNPILNLRYVLGRLKNSEGINRLALFGEYNPERPEHFIPHSFAIEDIVHYEVLDYVENNL